MDGKRAPIYLLDWVRFIAATLVAGWHLGFRLFDPHAPHINRFAEGLPLGSPLLPGATMFGWVGVEIFFVISGVVISYSAARATPASFFVNRAARLFPVVVLGTVIIACIDLFVWRMPVVSVAKSAILTILFSPSGNIAPQFWTIPVEVVFYALVWIYVIRKRTDRLESLAWILLVVSALYWIAVSSGLIPPATRVARNLLLQHGMYFSIGILIFSVATHGVSFIRILAIVSGCLLALGEVHFATGKYGIKQYIDPTGWLIPYAIWLASLGLIIVSLFARNAIGRFVERFNLAHTSRALGLATYPLYFLHIHVGGLFATIGMRLSLTPAAAVLFGFAVSVAASLLVALSLEPPMARWMKQVLTPLLARLFPSEGRLAPQP